MGVLRVVGVKKGNGVVVFEVEGEGEGEVEGVGIDVRYAEEDPSPYLLFNVKLRGVEVVAEVPFGDVWEMLSGTGEISLVFGDGSKRRLCLNEFQKGFVKGCFDLWKEVERLYE